MLTKNFLGIDFGSAACCVAEFSQQQVRVLPNAEGEKSTPSVVLPLDQTKFCAGQSAKQRAATNPSRAICDIKLRLSSGAPIETEHCLQQPEAIAAVLLDKLRADLTARHGGVSVDAVIAVPCFYDSVQRKRLKLAGMMAGFSEVQLLNETTATLLSFAWLKNPPDGNYLVVDGGACNFQCAVAELGKGELSVRAAGGIEFGGAQVDNLIVEFINQHLLENTGFDARCDALAQFRIREAAERTKIELSTVKTAQIQIPYLAVGKDAPIHCDLLLSRDHLYAQIKPSFQGAQKLISDVLAQSELDKPELNGILLVGGLSRMPILIEYFKEWGVRLISSFDHKDAVAQGGSIYGAYLNTTLGTKFKIEERSCLPVCLAAKGASANVVIPAGSVLPAEKTIEVAQPNVEIKQGRQPEDRTIAQLKIRFAQKLLSFEKPGFIVSLKVDNEGLVTFAARDRKSGQEQNVDNVLETADEKKLLAQAQSIAREREAAARKKLEQDLKMTVEGSIIEVERFLKVFAGKLPQETSNEARRKIRHAKSQLDGIASIADLELLIGTFDALLLTLGQVAQQTKKEVSKRTAEERLTEAKRHFQLGMSSYLQGDYSSAAEYFYLGLSEDSENFYYRLHLALSYAKLRQMVSARIELSRILDDCQDPQIITTAQTVIQAVNSLANEEQPKSIQPEQSPQATRTAPEDEITWLG